MQQHSRHGISLSQVADCRQCGNGLQQNSLHQALDKTQKDIFTASMVDVDSILSTSHLMCDKRIYKWTRDQILIHIWTPSWSCNHLNVQLKTQLGVVQLQPVCAPTQHLPVELELLRLLGALLPCLGFCAQHCRQAHTDIMGC